MHTVRIFRGSQYCSGVLIADDLTPRTRHRTRFVLTCGHFFAEHSSGRVRGLHFTRKVEAVHRVPGTDIAVVEMDRPSPAYDVPQVADRPLPIGARTVTAGTKGDRAGVALLRLPFAFSRMGTLVRPAHLVWAPAVKGDSGGAVLYQGMVYATQALILDPLGRSLGLSTVAPTGPHWHAIRAITLRR